MRAKSLHLRREIATKCLRIPSRSRFRFQRHVPRPNHEMKHDLSMRVLPRIVIREADSDLVDAIYVNKMNAAFDLTDLRSFYRSVPHRVREIEIVRLPGRSGDFE